MNGYLKSTLWSAVVAGGFLLGSVTSAPFLPAATALAQSWADDFDLFVDSRGRRFLVDPDTGEIVGRENPNARFTREDHLANALFRLH